MNRFKILGGILIFSLLMFANISETAAMSRRMRSRLEKAKEQYRREKYEGQRTEPDSYSSYKSDPNIARYTMRLRCSPCGGTGRKKCWQCGGQAGHWETVTVPNYSGISKRPSGRVWKKCSACNGTGLRNCEDCNGQGYILQDNRGNRIK